MKKKIVVKVCEKTVALYLCGFFFFCAWKYCVFFLFLQCCIFAYFVFFGVCEKLGLSWWCVSSAGLGE